jgi:MerR family transcriptional regulator, copper efflux regulator
MHQIGQVAERVGLSLRTVRYYEEMGLISPERRTNGGFRLYTDENLERLLLIKQMKPLGFTVQEMRELLNARDALRSLDPRDPKRSQAADKVSEFARDAGKRCGKLRRHLAAGQELVKELSRESGRERAPSPRD